MASSGLTSGPPIRTPDHRLRVFVSSTLKELAPERRAARQAIERIGAAPVMFELGARPHPPRELYRAYLEQSDIFVGLYWERYGWVAPGETVSGLEDEYNLAPPDMPRLIYIKETTGSRDARLDELLDRIRADDRASFKYFADARELGRLLPADLAVLLAERFDSSRSATPPAEPAPEEPRPVAANARLPVPLTQLYGREREIQDLSRMVLAADLRLLTLVGPGGIGKTRLAIEAARNVASQLPDGVAFVPLAPIDSPALVPNAVAQALGVRDSGDAPLEAKLLTALRERRMLLVLDNFEHVVEAAPFASTLLAGAPGLKILVTSRALLRLSGEHAVEVPPLPVPGERTAPWSPDETISPSVALFVDRARAVKPDFELIDENVRDVEAIVSRLDGVPLAIELAAARIRLLSPAALLDRLGRQLALLVGGPRDLPPRQQAVRSTIEWSTRLLSEEERRLLWRLGVFAGRFSLEAVEAIAPDGVDVLALLESLVDASLVRQQDRNGRTYFVLLATVREYALEQLELRGETGPVRELHARHYAGWARRLGEALDGPGQRERVKELGDERDNLRTAVRELLDAGEADEVAAMAWSLYRYWWIGSQFGEVARWMEEVLGSAVLISDRTRAIALCLTAIATFRKRPAEAVVSDLTESLHLFRRGRAPADEAIVLEFLAFARVSGPDSETEGVVEALRRSGELSLADQGHWGEAMAHITLGRLHLILRDVQTAHEEFAAATRAAEQQDDELMLPLAMHHLGWTHLMLGDAHAASDLMLRTLDLSLEIEHDLGVAYALEGFMAVAAAAGDREKAGLFAGAAERVRERAGIVSITDSIFQSRVLSELRAGDEGGLYERGRTEGRRLSAEHAAGLAHELAAVSPPPSPHAA